MAQAQHPLTSTLPLSVRRVYLLLYAHSCRFFNISHFSEIFLSIVSYSCLSKSFHCMHVYRMGDLNTSFNDVGFSWSHIKLKPHMSHSNNLRFEYFYVETYNIQQSHSVIFVYLDRSNVWFFEYPSQNFSFLNHYSIGSHTALQIRLLDNVHIFTMTSRTI